jgi:uncharacterized protein YbjT (DUF2867 family)
MHVIVGATGRLGSRVVERVAALGADTVAASRPVDWEASGTVLPAGVRRADVDLTVDGSVDPVVEGAQTVVATAHGRDVTTRDGSRKVDLEGSRRLLRACERGGVRQLVYVSTSSAGPQSPVDSFRYKAEIEDEIRASAVPWTILRPTHFMEVWTDVLTREVPKGRITVPGRGRTPTRWVAIDDAARAVASVVGNPDALGMTLPVAGPQALTVDEVAEMLSQATPGHPRVAHVPPPLLWVATIANSLHRPLFARHVRMTIALDSAAVPAPTDDELALAARILPPARTTWQDLLASSTSRPTAHQA